MFGATYAYATLPATDLERARKFYFQTLGLKPVSENPGGAFYEIGSTQVFVFHSTGESPGTFTQIAIRVEDIDVAMRKLKERGVAFEEYPNTVDGISTTGPVRSAWFKDSEGNLLGLTELK